MGIGGISIWQLLIILAIVVMLFGTKRLRGLGGDLGGAIKGFKKAMDDDKSGAEKIEDESDKPTEKVVHDETEKTDNKSGDDK